MVRLAVLFRGGLHVEVEGGLLEGALVKDARTAFIITIQVYAEEAAVLAIADPLLTYVADVAAGLGLDVQSHVEAGGALTFLGAVGRGAVINLNVDAAVAFEFTLGLAVALGPLVVAAAFLVATRGLVRGAVAVGVGV